jgi:xylose dehydrogenase (NAD/NADP)
VEIGCDPAIFVRMTRQLLWGVFGTGNIARQFCAGVANCERGRIAAVGSRGKESADTFARERGIERSYGSYDAVLSDATIDAVYISLPNSFHHEWTIKALRAGKHVLCEKPFAASALESEEMFAVAEKAGCVLIEAFMYRAHPLTHAVIAAVRGGEIGDLRLIRTSFCYRTSKVAGNIRFDPSMAGGALMDVGSYCINFARLCAACEPHAVSVTATRHASGVDEMAVGTLHFPNGVLASFTCGMGVQADNTAYVCGSEGFIEVPVPWKPPATGARFNIVQAVPPRQDVRQATSMVAGSGPRRSIEVDAGKEVYALEADDFAATVLDGKAPMVSRADTLGNMRVLDEMRRQIAETSIKGCVL